MGVVHNRARIGQDSLCCFSQCSMLDRVRCRTRSEGRGGTVRDACECEEESKPMACAMNNGKWAIRPHCVGYALKALI